jgi:pimeloyl-ACP methyl ester carboxylesterase
MGKISSCIIALQAMYFSTARLSTESPKQIRTSLGDVRYFKHEAEDPKLTIVFVHGGPGHAGAFRAQFKSPYPSANLVAYDRPGYGRSPMAPDSSSIEQQVQTLKEILQKERIHPRLVVAHSYGAYIALKAVIEEPSLADGLLLVSPVFQEQKLPASLLRAANFLSPLTPRAVTSQIRESFQLGDDISAALNTNVPIVSVCAKDDALASPQQTLLVEMAAQFGTPFGAQFVDHGGHFLQSTDPASVDRAIHQLEGMLR